MKARTNTLCEASVAVAILGEARVFAVCCFGKQREELAALEQEPALPWVAQRHRLSRQQGWPAKSRAHEDDPDHPGRQLDLASQDVTLQNA